MDGAPSRGRARARARAGGNLSPDESGNPGQPTPPSAEVYSHMYGEPRRSDGSDGSGSNGNGNGSNSENGSNGNGNGENGENGNGRGRGSPAESGGSPRGMAALQVGSPQETGPSVAMDYIVSRPSPNFVKKVQPVGQTVNIVSNYYQFRTHPNWRLSLYVIKIEPPVEDERKVRKLVAQKRDQIGSYLLTGFQLFSTRPINPDVATFQVQLENDPISYKVELEFKRVVEESEPLVFQFYNTVVRQIQYMMQFNLLGRHFFDPRGKVLFPNWRLELWPGFQNSIRQQEAGLMLNVESVWKVLSTSTVLDVLGEVRRSQPPNLQEALNEAIVGKMVITKYGKASRAYKIDRIDFGTTPRSTFDFKGSPKTYLEYYREKYGDKGIIRVESQPMIVSKPKLRDQRRGQVGDIYLVPELCYVCGLSEELRGNFRLMKDLATCLHMHPNDRLNQMQRFVTGVCRNPDISDNLKKWGIMLPPNPNPVQFPARVLNPTEIMMGNGQKALPNEKADWTNSFRSLRMLTSSRLANWAIVVTNRDRQGIPNLVGTLQRVGGPLGYQIQQPQIFSANNPGGFPQAIAEAMQKNAGKLDLIFIILPNKTADIYAAVKKRCSIDYGIPSQCFLAKNVESKGLMSIATKVVIQMNAKQGGLPWGVSNPMKKTKLMVLGYDVHHAGPAGGDSVGAMTATMDESLGIYYSCISNALQRSEVGTIVESLFNECLKAYFKKNGCLPEKIIMYRDGVGEGQLNQVYDIEVKAFKDRIASVYAMKKENPAKLTYIVVNKRISTRFFQRVGQDKYDNPKPGLVVDDMITRPERYDFFLVSQTARQGCVSPTYYNVLLQEDQMGPDRVQRFTWYMCHLYYNWSGTVAVPAPCQNAHKLAFLVGTALKRPAHANLAYQLHYL